MPEPEGYGEQTTLAESEIPSAEELARLREARLARAEQRQRQSARFRREHAFEEEERQRRALALRQKQQKFREERAQERELARGTEETGMEPVRFMKGKREVERESKRAEVMEEIPEVEYASPTRERTIAERTRPLTTAEKVLYERQRLTLEATPGGRYKVKSSAGEEKDFTSKAEAERYVSENQGKLVARKEYKKVEQLTERGIEYAREHLPTSFGKGERVRVKEGVYEREFGQRAPTPIQRGAPMATTRPAAEPMAYQPAIEPADFRPRYQPRITTTLPAGTAFVSPDARYYQMRSRLSGPRVRRIEQPSKFAWHGNPPRALQQMSDVVWKKKAGMPSLYENALFRGGNALRQMDALLAKRPSGIATPSRNMMGVQKVTNPFGRMNNPFGTLRPTLDRTPRMFGGFEGFFGGQKKRKKKSLLSW